jgi:hypothetical protein
MPISDPRAFWEEARYQRACAQCDSTGRFEAHHIIEKQWLKRHGFEWRDRYDTRAALRLCLLCHHGQTSKLKKVELKNLTLDNLEYAFEVMGAAAADYLHRHYEGPDRRVDELERKALLGAAA